MLPNEIWKPVPGFEGAYEVSSLGRVRGLDRTDHRGRFWPGRILNGSKERGNYVFFTACKDGSMTKFRIHRLVLEVFVGAAPDGKTQACHRNDIPTDNRLVNLYWGSPVENSADKLRNGRNDRAMKTHCKRGHEFTPENIRMTTTGGRSCKRCEHYRAQKRAEDEGRVYHPRSEKRTHCHRGHEYTDQNTYHRKDGKGRMCKACGEINRKRREFAETQKVIGTRVTVKIAD